MKTRRDKVAPKALLAPRREGLTDLADRVLTLIYGAHAETALMHRLMHQPAVSNLGDYVVGDDAEVVALVKSQIVCALGAGQIVLAIEFDMSSFERKTDRYVDRYEVMVVDNDNKFDFETEWVLAPRFWSEPNAADAISWSDSIVEAPTDFIYEGHSALEIVPPYKEWHPLSRHFSNLPPNIVAKAYVVNPDVALRRFFKFGPVPSEQQATEYRSAIANLVKEATAAAWRYLALNGVGRDFVQRELMRQMIV